MLSVLGNLGWFALALVAMEGVAWLTHRYVMHGCLWSLHRSHHVPREGVLEKNDWFVVFFATPSVALIYLGNNGVPEALWAGLGVATYGLIYFLFHDVLVHRRIEHDYRPRNRYLRRIVHAHRLHHATVEKHGAVSFGFLYAPPALVLREQMKSLASSSPGA